MSTSPRSPKTQAGARVSAGAPWLLYAVTGAVFGLFVFASIVSFSGLYAVAPWLGLPPYLYWALPLAVDLAIIVYKTAEVILRYDERKKAKVKKAILGTIVFTAISSAGNIVHVAALANPDPLAFWGGIGFAGIMPWAVYLAASVLTDLIVKPLRAAPVVEAEPAVVEAVRPAPVKKPAPKKAPTRPREVKPKPEPKPAPALQPFPSIQQAAVDA